MKSLKTALRSDEFATTAELSLSPQQSIAQIVDQASELARAADAIQIPDHRNARPHISPIAIGAHLLRQDIDPVVRMNCRDRNRIATQSDLLAARSFGIRNLLLARGSDLPEDHRPATTGVYDLSAIDLVKTAAAIRDREALVSADSGDADKFFIGTVATAFKPKQNWQPEKLLAKADAGAQFIQLQLCMNIDVLRSYIARLVEARLTWRFQVLANIAVLGSVEAARELRESNTAAIIPSSLVARIEQAQDPEAEGVAIAAETLRSLRDIPGIAGANLHSADDPDLVIAAIEQSRGAA